MATVRRKNEKCVFGTLNWEVYKHLSNDGKKHMVEMETMRILDRKELVNDKLIFTGIPPKDKSTYNISAKFIVMDFLLVEKEIVRAYMVCKRMDDGTFDIKTNRIQYEKKKEQDR